MFDYLLDGVQVAVLDGDNYLRQNLEVFDGERLGEAGPQLLIVHVHPIPFELVGRLLERRERTQTVIDVPLHRVGVLVAILQDAVVELEKVECVEQIVAEARARLLIGQLEQELLHCRRELLKVFKDKTKTYVLLFSLFFLRLLFVLCVLPLRLIAIYITNKKGKCQNSCIFCL